MKKLEYCKACIKTINDIFYFTIVAAIVTVALKLIMVYFSYNKFILALTMTMDNIYENNISIGYYLLALLFKYTVVFALFVATYFVSKNRRLRVNFN